jgi:hypothetical protein
LIVTTPRVPPLLPVRDYFYICIGGYPRFGWALPAEYCDL